MKIAEFMEQVQRFAPLALAMDWDNSGLQVGGYDWETQRAILCLDVNQAAMEAALEAKAGLIVAHHPLIFRPVKQISDPLLLGLIQNRIAVVSLHTNLDCAPGGVNHALAARLGLKVIDRLSESTGETWHRVSVSAPEEHIEKLRRAIVEADAGKIGSYLGCTDIWPVEGTFRPSEGAHPYALGEQDETGLSHTRDIKLEFMCDKARLGAVLAAIHAVHPYETPAIYHFPVANANPAYGLGLVCEAREPVTLSGLADMCKSALSCPSPRVWSAGTPMDKPLRRIAVCGGSGGSLLKEAARKADVFISGDLSYHSLLESSIPAIDAGHFYTEYPALESLAEVLEGCGLPCNVLPAGLHDWVRNINTFA